MMGLRNFPRRLLNTKTVKEKGEIDIALKKIKEQNKLIRTKEKGRSPLLKVHVQ